MSDLREIVLDTETTGLDIKNGHRIIEIGCVELINKVKTGRYFHKYINPKRPVDRGAYNVHGISDTFLRDKPVFSAIVNEFLEFIHDSPLIIHNAKFDMRFINNELNLLGIESLAEIRAIDTLMLARKRFPGSPASLDALCKRFNISLESRNKHGALLDSELLAMVYIYLKPASQTILTIDSSTDVKTKENIVNTYIKRQFTLSEEEEMLHKKMIASIKGSIW